MDQPSESQDQPRPTPFVMGPTEAAQWRRYDAVRSTLGTDDPRSVVPALRAATRVSWERGGV